MATQHAGQKGLKMAIALCPASALQENGPGQRFKVLFNGQIQSAFVLRSQGQVYAYLNRCAHQPVELDWNYGEFLDDSGQFIVCASHGAEYEAHSGLCVAGPCVGSTLARLHVEEIEGTVYWHPDSGPTLGLAIPPEGIED